MMFVTVILVLFILLILISIANTLIFMSLKLVTKEHYNEHYLILASFLTLLLWSLAYTVIVNVIAAVTKSTVFEAISASIFNTSSYREFLPQLLLPIIAIVAITLSLQALVLLTVNIDYNIVSNKLKYFTKGKFNKIINKFRRHQYHDMICGETITGSRQNSLEIVEEKYVLTYVNAFVCGLFIFSLLFFINILFFWIGSAIGHTIIK